MAKSLKNYTRISSKWPWKDFGNWNLSFSFGGGTAPMSRRLNVVVRYPPLLRVMGRNGETSTPRGPTIRSSPIVWIS